MFHISIKVGFTPKTKTPMTQVTCSHCSRVYSVAPSEVRAMNYCSNCK